MNGERQPAVSYYHFIIIFFFGVPLICGVTYMSSLFSGILVVGLVHRVVFTSASISSDGTFSMSRGVVFLIGWLL